MKRYKVLCDSVTGIKGAQLTKDNIYNEDAFNGTHIADLVSGKFITEVLDESATAATKSKPSKDDSNGAI